MALTLIYDVQDQSLKFVFETQEEAMEWRINLPLHGDMTFDLKLTTPTTFTLKNDAADCLAISSGEISLNFGVEAGAALYIHGLLVQHSMGASAKVENNTLIFDPQYFSLNNPNLSSNSDVFTKKQPEKKSPIKIKHPLTASKKTISKLNPELFLDIQTQIKSLNTKIQSNPGSSDILMWQSKIDFLSSILRENTQGNLNETTLSSSKTQYPLFSKGLFSTTQSHAEQVEKKLANFSKLEADIETHIQALNTEIQNNQDDASSIAMWTAKITVLEAALKFLHCETTSSELQTTINQNDEYAKSAWLGCMGTSNTQKLMDKVLALNSQPASPEKKQPPKQKRRSALEVIKSGDGLVRMHKTFTYERKRLLDPTKYADSDTELADKARQVNKAEKLMYTEKKTLEWQRNRRLPKNPNKIRNDTKACSTSLLTTGGFACLWAGVGTNKDPDTFPIGYLFDHRKCRPAHHAYFKENAWTLGRTWFRDHNNQEISPDCMAEFTRKRVATFSEFRAHVNDPGNTSKGNNEAYMHLSIDALSGIIIRSVPYFNQRVLARFKAIREKLMTEMELRVSELDIVVGNPAQGEECFLYERPQQIHDMKPFIEGMKPDELNELFSGEYALIRETFFQHVALEDPAQKIAFSLN